MKHMLVSFALFALAAGCAVDVEESEPAPEMGKIEGIEEVGTHTEGDRCTESCWYTCYDICYTDLDCTRDCFAGYCCPKVE